MSDIRGVLNSFSQTYGRPALLALLLHTVLLAALLQTEFTPLAKPPLTEPAVSEPIVSYLYQPPKPVPAETQPPVTENTVAPEVVQSTPANTVPPAVTAEQRPASQQQSAAAPLPDRADKRSTEHTATAPRQSLAQRAFNRAATVDPVAIEQAATANYQQLLQAQQQPKMTVEKRHQELSNDPAQQVVAELGDGIQLIRIKGGCRIGDPAKDGFDGLMAARVVPCGDEAKTSDLLKQALEKHSKR
ncbi:MAG: hypothetical protein KKE30_16755 [Gammaproteobacteria bacterium]|nr:hypothetical protein [Gammaproteobacteria bacterium]MBU1555003.1 hypothetical protein [Gammaproteobacteria bacterium]MBU2070936.1 hypothetical protein [Gammaproteobacteria bacterium]MBU2181556.1 hypothetical protein [Gammaproteobacteria bacterium]MBU2204866.1 hypothetical protein [Gammaproteobacteria bacterium]